MTKTEFAELLSRRLAVPQARIASILERLHAAGVVHPEKGSRRYPREIDEHDAVAILLAVLADRGLATVADDACALAATGDGERFDNWLGMLLFGPPRHVMHLIVGQAGASASVDGQHITFGTPPRTSAKCVPGRAVMAIAAELQGARPADADAIAEIQGIHHGY